MVESLEFKERSSPPKISGDSAMTINRFIVLDSDSFYGANIEVVSNNTLIIAHMF